MDHVFYPGKNVKNQTLKNFKNQNLKNSKKSLKNFRHNLQKSENSRLNCVTHVRTRAESPFLNVVPESLKSLYTGLSMIVLSQGILSGFRLEILTDSTIYVKSFVKIRVFLTHI